MTPAGSRLPAAVVLGVLTLGLLVALVVTTPWHPLGTGHVPGGAARVDPHLDFDAAAFARDRAFHAVVRPPAYLGYAIGLLVPVLLGLTPLGARLINAVARPFGGGWPVRAVLGGLVVGLVIRLSQLPTDVIVERALRRYGLSTQNWSGWANDQLRAAAVTAVISAVAILAVVALARWSPQRWWIPASAAGAVLVVAVSFAYPVLVEPLFNKFQPLSAGPLRTSLLELAAKDGVPVRDVLVADASRRTTALNAYVSGFGATRRIVIYDTLLAVSTPAEIRLVVAHELGHAKRFDVLRGTLLGAVAVAAVVCALFLLLNWQPLLRRAGGVRLADGSAIALAIAITTVLAALSAPLGNLVSRRIEARADVHALDLTRDPATFIASERSLALTNLASLQPPRLAYLLFATHPSTAKRIALARDWALLHGVPEPPPTVATAGSAPR